MEKYTIQRFGIEDGEVIEWADLGPTISDGCN
jgi:hypothetical protein